MSCDIITGLHGSNLVLTRPEVSLLSTVVLPPRLSVVVFVLNAGETLEKALASVVQQNGAPTELLVLDGGSTDGTLDRLRVEHHAEPTLLLIPCTNAKHTKGFERIGASYAPKLSAKSRRSFFARFASDALNRRNLFKSTGSAKGRRVVRRPERAAHILQPRQTMPSDALKASSR